MNKISRCFSFLLLQVFYIAWSSCSAQIPYTASFVARLGTDTVIVETYSMVNNHLFGKAFIRVPEDYIGVFDLHFYPDGSIKTFSIAAMDPENSSVPYPAHAGRFSYMQNMLCENDTCYWFSSHKNNSGEYANKHQAPSMDFLGGWTPILSLFEWNAVRLKKSGRDWLPLRMINDYIGVYEIGIRAAAKDSLIFGGPFLEYTRLKVNEEGRILSINGTGTPWNYTVTKHPPINIDDIAKRMSKTPPVGVPSPEVVEHFMVAGSKISVSYGKPSKRGRKIFGGIVPYDSVWRTGASHPTVISLGDNIKIGTTIIPKGKYSLYSIPRQGNWTLIFNTDIKKWPTDPNRVKDFAQVELTTRKLATPVEQFKIEIVEIDKTGLLKFIWDDVESSTKFIVIKE